MDKMIVHIYKVKDNTSHILNCVDIRLNKKIDYITSITNTIYIYNNLHLIVDENNMKTCIKYSHEATELINTKFLKEIIKCDKVPIDNFPFINKYDQIIKQHVQTYNFNNIEFSIVSENSNNEKISFICMDNNDTNMNKIFSFIE